MGNDHTRFVNDNNEVAQQRYRLYKAGWEQIKKAEESGFFIEAVMILDSIISDRIDARYQFLIRNTNKTISPVPTKGAVQRILNSERETEQDFLDIYKELQDWTIDRNIVAHSFITVTTENQHLSVDERKTHIEKTMKEGKDLANRLRSLTGKYNNYEKKE